MKDFVLFRMITAILLCAVMTLTCAIPAFAEDTAVADCCDELASGDANSDGKVDFKDASRMIRHCAGFDDEIDPDNADVQNDSEINMKDVFLLLKVLAGRDGVRLGHLDGYGKCALCGSYAEYFDSTSALCEWLCDMDMSGPFHTHTAFLRDNGDIFNEAGFQTIAHYNDMSGYIELTDFVWDFDHNIFCVITPNDEPGKAWTVIYEESYLDIERYEDIAAGNVAGRTYVTLSGYINENGSFCIDPTMCIDSMAPIDIPEDKLGEYEHYVSVSIGNITEFLDEAFEESGAPLNSTDIRLK